MSDPWSVSGPSSTRRARARAALQWPTLVWLTVVWCLLWGEFSIGNVLAGLLVSVLAVRVFPLPPLLFDARPHPVALLRLTLVFLADLVRSSLQVARIALRPGYQPTNSVILVPLRTRSDFALFVTAEMLSLVPGSLLIEGSRRTWTLQLHIIDTPTVADVERARRKAYEQERRVVEALGSDEEIARVHQPPPGGGGGVPPVPPTHGGAGR